MLCSPGCCVFGVCGYTARCCVPFHRERSQVFDGVVVGTFAGLRMLSLVVF